MTSNGVDEYHIKSMEIPLNERPNGHSGRMDLKLHGIYSLYGVRTQNHMTQVRNMYQLLP